MLTRRQFNKLLLSSVLIPSFGCTQELKKDYLSKTLRLNLGFEPDTLDWLRATDSYSFDVIANIMVGLTKYNNDLKSIPSLAKTWDVKNNGKTYIFYLDKNAKWIDEKPVTAHDFTFAWERLLNPKTAAPYAYLMHPIKNAYLYNTGKITDKNLLGINAPDDFTFQVDLEEPLAFFLNITSYCFSFPQRKDVIEKHSDNWTKPKNIITCGPFKLDKWDHEYKLELSKNNLYKNPEPKLEKVKFYVVPQQSSGFSLYLNNEIDLTDKRSIPVSEVETVKKMQDAIFSPLLRCTYMGFNVTKPPFNNKLVRKAFSHAIDRKIFPKILGRNEIPTNAFIPPGLKDFYTPEIGCDYNPEKAKSFLAEAGFPNGKNFPKIEMLFPTRNDVKLYLEAIQAQIKKILNVHIELINQEWKVYLSTLQQNPSPIFRMSWGADYPDPDTFMTLFSSNSGNNFGRWKNKEYDELINAGARTIDLEKRISLYKKAQKILLEDEVAIAPLFFDTQIFLKKPWVKNFECNALDVVFIEKIAVQ